MKESGNSPLIPPGYKQTEVGVIPEEWEVHPFEKLAHIERGKFTARPRNDPKFYGGDIPFIQTGDVTNAKGYINSFVQTLNAEGLKVSKLFPSGTLFFTIAANIGDVGFTTFDAACPDSLVAITPTTHTDKVWLSYELAKRKASFESIATHNAQLNINLEKLRPYLLPLPPLPEQRAIATALSDVDALLSGLERLIAKKRDLKQAAMQQLLTGQTRLPGFHGEWEVKRLGEVAEIVMGQSPSSANYNTQGEGLPLIQGNADVLNRETIIRVFTKQVTKRGRIGDILMSVRAPVGEVSRATFDVCLGRGVCAIRYPNDFLYHYLIFLEPTWAKHSKGSTFDSVNSTDVNGVEIKFPASLSEQTAIAAVLSDMDAELAALEDRRAKTRDLKQAMMQDLLTGNTRLVHGGFNG